MRPTIVSSTTLTSVLGLALIIAGCADSCGCGAQRASDGGAEAPRQDPPASAGVAAPAGSTGTGAGVLADTGSVGDADVVESEPDAFRLPTTGSPQEPPSTTTVTARATPDRITIGETAPVALTGEGAIEDPADLRLELGSRIREAADAVFLRRLETATDPSSIRDETAVVVLVEADANLPAGALAALLDAAAAQGQMAWLVGASPSGERRWVRHAGDSPLPWTPSEPPDLVPLPDRPRRDGERRPPIDTGQAPPRADEPLPGPSWEDRSLPIEVTILPAGVWVTAGTLERRLPGHRPTGVARDGSHPNVAAHGVYQPGMTLTEWLDWSTLGRELDRAHDRALGYRLEPSITVNASSDVPVEVLYRTLDVIQLDVGDGARIAGGEAFERALLSGEAVPGYLPRPDIRVAEGRAGFDGRPGQRTRIVLPPE